MIEEKMLKAEMKRLRTNKRQRDITKYKRERTDYLKTLKPEELIKIIEDQDEL